MARFEIQHPDGASYEVDAPDEASALATFQRFRGGSQDRPGGGAIHIQAPDGGLVEFPEGTSDDTITSVMRQNYPAPAASPAAREPPGMFESAVRGIAQGATLGYGDEIKGAVGGVGGLVSGEGWEKGYTDARDRERARNRAAEEAHPWVSTAGKVYGGIASLAPAMAAAPARFGVAAGQSLAARAGAGLTSGAAIGGVQGFGEGEGGISDRFEHALPAAGAGAGFGILGAGVGAGVGAASRAFTNTVAPRLTGMGGAASRDLVSAYEAVGPGVAERRAAELGPQAMVLDTGQPFQGRAMGLAAENGAPGDRIVYGLMARDEGANPRLAQALDENFGPAASARQTEAQFQGIRDAAGPRYEAATANAPPIDTTDALAVVAQRLNTAEGAERAGLSHAVDLLMPRRGPDGSRIVQTDARNLHSAKQALDDLVQYGDPTVGIPRGAFSSRDSAVFRVRQALNDALEAQAPGYAEANLMMRTAHRASEALESGKHVLDAGESAIHPADFTAGFNALPLEQQAALRSGVRSDLDRIVGTKANDLAALRREVMSDGDWNRAKLAEVFGPDEAARVANAVDRETAFRDAFTRISQGSQSAQRLAGMKAVAVRDAAPSASDVGVTISGALGGPASAAGAMAMKAGRFGWGILGRGRDLARNDEVGRGLMMAGSDRDALLAEMRQAAADKAAGHLTADERARIGQILISGGGRTDEAEWAAAVTSRKAREIGQHLLGYR